MNVLKLQIVKLYAWELAFYKEVLGIRKNEVLNVIFFYLIMGISALFFAEIYLLNIIV